MLSTLQAFLVTAAQETNEKIVKVSERLPQGIKIRALDLDEWEQIQKLSTNKSAGIDRIDNIGLLRRCVLAACVDPCFRDDEFVKAVGALTSDEALKKTLKAGEILKLGNEILKFSGFAESVEEARAMAAD